MKTADTSQSDPDFAGLIVRCASKAAIDVLWPQSGASPPQSHPKVLMAAVRLRDEVQALAAGKWQTTLRCLLLTRGAPARQRNGALEWAARSLSWLLTICGQ
ncbi:hypothetical protein [Bradyrhizobium tunisiense]|uniref:hypothetical protein n=1 Tax=Bradyrhizobium tunisiense TaxID=3278709 RepID=UPI0035E0E53C